MPGGKRPAGHPARRPVRVAAAVGARARTPRPGRAVRAARPPPAPPAPHLRRRRVARGRRVRRARRRSAGRGDGDLRAQLRDRDRHPGRARLGADTAAEGLADGLAGELSEYLFATDERPIAEIVLDLARARGLTLATAESCTGGMIGAWLTDIPGSSAVFPGAIVSYSDEPSGRCWAFRRTSWRPTAPSAPRPRPGDGRRRPAGARCRPRSLRDRDRRPRRRPWSKPVGLVYTHVSSPAGETAAGPSSPADGLPSAPAPRSPVLHMLRRHLVTDL